MGWVAAWRRGGQPRLRGQGAAQVRFLARIVGPPPPRCSWGVRRPQHSAADDHWRCALGSLFLDVVPGDEVGAGADIGLRLGVHKNCHGTCGTDACSVHALPLAFHDYVHIYAAMRSRLAAAGNYPGPVPLDDHGAVTAAIGHSASGTPGVHDVNVRTIQINRPHSGFTLMQLRVLGFDPDESYSVQCVSNHA
eukprot:SAG25_NODE_313_length_9986_cov_6.931324_4_plen_193_part_00